MYVINHNNMATCVKFPLYKCNAKHENERCGDVCHKNKEQLTVRQPLNMAAYSLLFKSIENALNILS